MSKTVQVFEQEVENLKYLLKAIERVIDPTTVTTRSAAIVDKPAWQELERSYLSAGRMGLIDKLVGRKE